MHPGKRKKEGFSDGGLACVLWLFCWRLKIPFQQFQQSSSKTHDQPMFEIPCFVGNEAQAELSSYSAKSINTWRNISSYFSVTKLKVHTLSHPNQEVNIISV